MRLRIEGKVWGSNTALTKEKGEREKEKNANCQVRM